MELLTDLLYAALPILLLYAVALVVSPLSMLSQLGKRRNK